MRKSLRIYGTAVLLMVLAVLSIAGAAQAAYPAHAPAPPGRAASGPNVPVTHGRLSQLNWQVISGNTVAFHAVTGLRRSFFNPPPNVGSTVAFAPIQYGDGFQSANTLFTVTFVDTARDWFIAEKNDTHTYSGPGPWTANFNQCCRLSPPQHRNNGDQAFRAEALVNIAQTTANPVSSLPAIVDCPREGLCTFTIPAFDPDNQTMRFRMATAAEAGAGNFHQPGPPEAPNAATINATSGVYTWDTHGASINPTPNQDTLYSTQIMIENLNAQGQVIAKTPVDFFIRLIVITNNPPQFIVPTPPDGTIFTVNVGSSINVPVTAEDVDVSDQVSLAVINLPSGATFPLPAPNNPVSSLLSWTPTFADLGPHVINFIATDSPGGAQDFTSIVINVVGSTPTPTSTHTPTRTPTGTRTPEPPSNTPTVTRTATASPTPPPPKPSSTRTPPKPSSTPTLPPPPPTVTATLPPPPPTVTCVPQTPTRIPTPPYTPAPGCSPNPGSRLDADITLLAGSSDATFNNRSSTCSYRIGLAVYRKVDNNIDHQELYDYRLAVIPPNSSLTLTVNNPPCAFQVDAFYGDILYSLNGQRYGSRLLDDRHGNGNNWCPPVCPPVRLPPVGDPPTKN